MAEKRTIHDADVAVVGSGPGGVTVRLGEMVDADLQTTIRNLYVCDASVFPEALGQPTVLTIISFGKRLSDHLLRSVLQQEAAPATATSE